MLTCLPASLCSWDYRILGCRAGEAALTFKRMSQQGEIQLGNSRFDVVKQSILLGKWSLEGPAGTFGHAEKTPLIRQFQVQTSGDPLMLEGQFLSGVYRLVTGGREVGTIRRMHPFTRRAVIECSDAVPELDLLFALWLVAITWRNASRD